MRKHIMKHKYRFTCILLIMVATIAGCDNDAVFTEMASNRLTVVIKGTYASNNPQDWDSVAISDVYNLPLANGSMDDSVDDCSIAGDVFPTALMLDIAEMRLTDSSGDNEAKFSNYRQTSVVSIDDSDPFFNGTGIILQNDDVTPGRNYAWLKVFMRKMIFNNAKRYNVSSSGWVEDIDPVETIFREETTEGFDFNQLQTNTIYDSLREEASDINRVFPIRIPIIGGLEFDNRDEETVLEIRILVKNFVKKYEYDTYDESLYSVIHFYGLSDWLWDVQPGEKTMGGNVIAVARAYVPSRVGTITATGLTTGDYLIAIPESEAITDYYIETNANDRPSDCDFPKAPSYSGTYVEHYLDYLLKYERYKSDWNTVLGTCPDQETYESSWNTYKDGIDSFRMPPIVTYIDSGTSGTLENVPPGTYRVYSVAAPLIYGDLFDGTYIFDECLEGVVTVTAGSPSAVTF